MTYEEAREFISNSNQYGSKLGLEAITELMKRLGNPQDQLRVIHVAGTNGKGSTSAFITSILAAAGYRVGRYLSPSVFTYREIIQITAKEKRAENQKSGSREICNNERESQDSAEYDNTGITTEYITEQGVAASIELIRPVCEAMVKEGLPHPTTFEIETAMAFLYLMQSQVDFAVIEVGMGGRLDATNVIKKPVCSVITSISMDHMQYLGNTIESIAFEKAGIIKKGSPVVTGNSDPRVLGVLRQVCEEQKAELTVADLEGVKDITYFPDKTSFRYKNQSYRITLLGEYQIRNAILAIETAQVLRGLDYPISSSDIGEGLLHAKWSGRFEIIAEKPYFIIDGAHNEDAALRLNVTLQKYFPKNRLIFIMGVLADKDYKKILKIMAGRAEVIITLTPDNRRALSSKELAAEAAHYTNGTVIDAINISSAVDCAYNNIKGKDDVILAFGSLSYLGELYHYVKGSTVILP